MDAGAVVYPTYRFSIEIDSVLTASFTECRGLESELSVQEIAEGGRNDLIHLLPGRPQSSPRIVLKRGLAQSDLWDWYQGIVAGTIQRRNIAIVLHGYTGIQELRWSVVAALPVKWSGPALKADMNEVTVETLEFVHQGITIGGVTLPAGGKGASNASSAGGSDGSHASAQSRVIQRVGGGEAQSEVDLDRLTSAVERLFQQDRRIGKERLLGAENRKPRTKYRL